MKLYIKTSLALFLSFLSLCVHANAQDYNKAQTVQEQQVLQRVKEKVKLMNDYISDMADKSNSVESRRYFRKKALPLFIGKGYEYEENGITKGGVLMQTTSVNRGGSVKSDLLRNYFSRLIELKYSDVIITSTEIADMKVSDLKKVDENLYMCTCQYVQYFRGYRDGRYTYGDKTTKRIVCYVETEYTEDGLEYMIMLGDVECLCTERL